MSAGLTPRKSTPAHVLVSMLQLLWHNQERHAQPDGTIVDVTQDEAETAVTLATTLVHWLTSGLVVHSVK
jgi:hypothetical protein